MKVLLDLNVILDVLLNRAPWVAESGQVWDAHRAGRLSAFVAALSLPTIFYIARRQIGQTRANEAVRMCLETLEVVPTLRCTLETGQQQTGPDFEDNLQIASAVEQGVDAIVTRDPVDFADSLIAVLTPAQLLQQLAAPQP